jgi:hypothetical protein
MVDVVRILRSYTTSAAVSEWVCGGACVGGGGACGCCAGCACNKKLLCPAGEWEGVGLCVIVGWWCGACVGGGGVVTWWCGGVVMWL